MNKKFCSMILSIALILSLVPMCSVGAFAETPVSYRYPIYVDNTTTSGIDHWVENASCSAYTQVFNTDITWGAIGNDSWYYATGNIEINKPD